MAVSVVNLEHLGPIGRLLVAAIPPVEARLKMSRVSAVKPVVPKCSVPKSVPFGKSAELSCVEEEGFPKSHYQWFKNREEVPDDPKTSLKFLNSSYTLNSETGTLVSASARAFGQGHA